ncbi:MAG: hypothetical protein NVS3B1_14310 [Marmoricola sp.]
MKVTTFGKAGLSLATAAAMTLSLGVAAATATVAPLTASQEDPTTATYLGGAGVGQYTLVGTGSDTIQDVEYGIAQDLGTYTGSDGSTHYANIASWTATGTTSMSYRSGGHPATATVHPNGSGAGYTTLKESLGITPTGVDGVAAGDVDFSRASGTQGVATPNGVVTEIPFATDAISFAAPAGSPFLKTNGGAGLKLQDLADIYSGAVNEINTSTGVLGKTTGALDANNEFIQAFLPKAGSGSRQFFLKQLNKFDNGAIAYGSDKGDSDFASAGTPVDNTSYVGAVDYSGNPVQEHDASILTSAPADVAAIAPFSAAKFIGYHNGKIADPDTGKVAGTNYVLVPFDSSSGAVLPYTGDASTNASLVPNSAYQTQGTETPVGTTASASVTRQVYNIIPTAAVTNPNANVKYRALYDTFVGPYSKFCSDSATIQAYGFLTYANCGSTSFTADVASTPTVTVSNTPATAGKSSVFTFAVQSNGNGGGTATVTINGHVYTGTIPAGSTSVHFTVPTPAAGTFQYGGGAGDGFVPNLAGVASAPVNLNPGTPLTYTVAKATPVVKATAARVSHLRIGSAVVTVSATGLVATGTVRVQVRTTHGVLKLTSAARSLSGGKVVVSFGKTLPAGTYYVWVTYSGNANINGKSYTRLATLSVY